MQSEKRNSNNETPKKTKNKYMPPTDSNYPNNTDELAGTRLPTALGEPPATRTGGSSRDGGGSYTSRLKRIGQEVQGSDHGRLG